MLVLYWRSIVVVGICWMMVCVFLLWCIWCGCCDRVRERCGRWFIGCCWRICNGWLMIILLGDVFGVMLVSGWYFFVWLFVGVSVLLCRCFVVLFFLVLVCWVGFWWCCLGLGCWLVWCFWLLLDGGVVSRLLMLLFVLVLYLVWCFLDLLMVMLWWFGVLFVGCYWLGSVWCFFWKWFLLVYCFLLLLGWWFCVCLFCVWWYWWCCLCWWWWWFVFWIVGVCGCLFLFFVVGYWSWEMCLVVVREMVCVFGFWLFDFMVVCWFGSLYIWDSLLLKMIDDLRMVLLGKLLLNVIVGYC